MGIGSFVRAIFVVVGVVVGLHGQARSGENKSPAPPVTAWNGSFSYSVPIDVPAFRGLEPKLALTYARIRRPTNGK